MVIAFGSYGFTAKADAYGFTAKADASGVDLKVLCKSVAPPKKSIRLHETSLCRRANTHRDGWKINAKW